MSFQNQFTKTTTDANLMETVHHGSAEYPFRYYYENIALFDFKCIDWHWHSELEFIYIESGNVVFDIGTVHFELNEGNGIMINSKILHRLQSSSDAIIPNFLFQPSFIAPQDSLIYKKYINPVISSSLEYLVFQPDIPWQKKALEIIKTIIAVQETEFNREIIVSMSVQQLWILLLENLTFDQFENMGAVISRTRLQLMMQYVHAHYSENITLEDIARTANISKSTALHLFQNNLKLTPVKYLSYIVSILCYVHNSSQKPCRNLFHRWNAPANPLAVAKFQRHLDSGSTFEILYQFTDRCRWFHSDRDRMWYPGSLCTCTNEIQR